MIGIYKITCTENGRCYVGATKDFQARKLSHLCALRSGDNKNLAMQEDFNKYRGHAFVFEMIEECANELLDEREVYWIENLKAYDLEIGYNMTFGGAGLPATEFLKRKLRESQLGKKRTEEHKANQSKAAKDRFKNPEERKKSGNKLRKTVIQSSIDGNRVNEFGSLREASRVTGIDCGHISKCCNGKRDQAGGYKWNFNQE